MSEVIINDTTPREQFTATAGQTVFNVLFTADAGSDVDVYARAAGVAANDVTQIVSPNDYNITFIGGSETVRVTFLVGRTLNDVITIARNTPPARLNLYGNTNFTPDMLNQDFGILTLVDQQAQMYDNVLGPHYNVSATIDAADPTPADVILPVLPAGHGWRKNDGNTAIETVAVPVGGSAPSDATFLLKIADADLPNAQAMGALASGFVVSTTGTGVQLTRILRPTVGGRELLISNGSGITGDPVIALSTDINMPDFFTVKDSTRINGIIDDDSFGTASATNIATAESTKQFILDQIGIGPVQSLQGTANQVLVDGTSGSPQTGLLILTTPQDIGTGSSPIFNNLRLNGAVISGSAGNAVLTLSDSAGSINGLTITNGSIGNGPRLEATGTDANISFTIATKGTGALGLLAAHTTQPLIIFSGIAAQHITRFIMSNTAADRSVTFQDAAGTVAYLSDVAAVVTSITGTANQVIASAATGAVTLSLPQSIATTSSPTFAALTLTAPLTGANGGTGVNNGASTFTIGGSTSFVGAFTFAGTVTANTAVTFPTTGTLVNTAVTTLSSLTSVGTIGTGVWGGSIVTPTFGGTGINNGSFTIQLGGSLLTAGAFATTLNVTADTNIVLPTTGTLATLTGAEALTNKTQITVDNLELNGNTLSSTDANGNVNITPNGTGQVLKSVQSRLEAVDCSMTDCTGDGTNVDVIFPTEAADIGANYNNATGVFTCRTSGNYLINVVLDIRQLGALFTLADIRLVTTSAVVASPRLFYGNIGVVQSGGLFMFAASVMGRLIAAETVKITMAISGSTKTVDIADGKLSIYLLG